MSDNRTARERLWNRIFAIPAVAQLWAKLSARQTGNLLGLADEIPFTAADKPLAAATIALLTTGGIHLPNQPPFDMDNPDGDATYRTLPGDVDAAQMVITHKYYDHTDADRDPGIIFPLAHFRDLVAAGVVGALAPRHFGFMGHIDGEQVARLRGRTAPEVAAMLRADGVDYAFLTPA